jgi:hypothetical protein
VHDGTDARPDRIETPFAATIAAWKTPESFDALAIPWSNLLAQANGPQNGRPGRMALVGEPRLAAGGELEAFFVAHVVRKLAVGDYAGGALERFTAWARGTGWTPLAFDIGYLEVPLANRCGLLLAPRLTDEERRAAWAWALDVARAKVRCDALCVKVDADDALASGILAQHRLVPLPFVDSHVVDIPAGGYAQWLEERGARWRRTVRRNTRIFAEKGGTLELAHDPSSIAPVLADYLARTAANARSRGELPLPLDVGPALFEGFRANMGASGEVCLARVGGEIAAFAMLVFTRDMLFVKFVGMDYARSRDTLAYFALFYRAIELAAERGMRRVDLGTTGTAFKETLGAKRIPTKYFVDFRHWALRPMAAMLRARFSGRAAAEERATPAEGA